MEDSEAPEGRISWQEGGEARGAREAWNGLLVIPGNEMLRRSQIGFFFLCADRLPFFLSLVISPPPFSFFFVTLLLLLSFACSLLPQAFVRVRIFFYAPF